MKMFLILQVGILVGSQFQLAESADAAKGKPGLYQSRTARSYRPIGPRARARVVKGNIERHKSAQLPLPRTRETRMALVHRALGRKNSTFKPSYQTAKARRLIEKLIVDNKTMSFENVVDMTFDPASKLFTVHMESDGVTDAIQGKYVSTHSRFLNTIGLDGALFVEKGKDLSREEIITRQMNWLVRGDWGEVQLKEIIVETQSINGRKNNRRLTIKPTEIRSVTVEDYNGKKRSEIIIVTAKGTVVVRNDAQFDAVVKTNHEGEPSQTEIWEKEFSVTKLFSVSFTTKHILGFDIASLFL